MNVLNTKGQNNRHGLGNQKVARLENAVLMNIFLNSCSYLVGRNGPTIDHEVLQGGRLLNKVIHGEGGPEQVTPMKQL